MRTHYDNLKVSKDAPIEVIQAAYRSLAKKYHPDINKDNPDAARIMKIINSSYEILSDPQKRKEHDSWIIKETWRERAEATLKKNAQTPTPTPTPTPTQEVKKDKKSLITKIIDLIFSIFSLLRLGLGFCVIGFVVYAIISGIYKTSVSLTDSKSDNTHITEASKPKTLVNSINVCDSSVQNRKWPISSTIFNQKDRRNGLSSLTLDNTKNNEDIYVKFTFEEDKNTSKFLRDVFIPAGNYAVLEKIPVGIYRVKTQNTNTGCVQISEPITMIERKTATGIEYSDNSLTFYSVINGNTHFSTLPASQF
ncbi:J domain-containing protein [Pectobacterium brasiliense]|uniref:J domain-containing protein n=1 Tax=Pectobacterium brasiliense TaxID=180957 RepID=UPI00398578C6